MQTVTSTDGTAIAYDVRGDGPPVVLVGGAFNDRHSPADLAETLSTRYTAVTYDRRGRGDSGDTAPYAVNREIEDLAAVIAAVGSPARLYGNSSGGVLAMRAAAAGVPVERLAILEPPFRGDGARPLPERYRETLVQLTVDGRHGDAVEYFLTRAVGLPPEAVERTRRSPAWPALQRMAPTLVYDTDVTGDGGLPVALLAEVVTPTLVLASASSAPWLRAAASAVAAALAHGEYRSLAGAFHSLPPDVLTPALVEFFES
jgi:alpha-beta hydrolase superfamily lysophospholipase